MFVVQFFVGYRFHSCIQYMLAGCFLNLTLLLACSLAFTQQLSAAARFHVADFYTVSALKSSSPCLKSERSLIHTLEQRRKNTAAIAVSGLMVGRGDRRLPRASPAQGCAVERPSSSAGTGHSSGLRCSCGPPVGAGRPCGNGLPARHAGAKPCSAAAQPQSRAAGASAATQWQSKPKSPQPPFAKVG